MELLRVIKFIARFDDLVPQTDPNSDPSLQLPDPHPHHELALILLQALHQREALSIAA